MSGILQSRFIVPASGGYLLDTIGTSAAVAYSTRKLRTAYAGYALKVRRSSDDTTLDVGFDGSGNLDTSAIALFISSSNGFIDTWYDQSGNGINITQATTAQQPQIAASGTIYTKNSKSVIKLIRSSSTTLSNSTTSTAAAEIATVFSTLDVTFGDYYGLLSDQATSNDVLNATGSGADYWYSGLPWDTYLRNGSANPSRFITMSDVWQQHDVYKSSGTRSFKVLIGSDRYLSGRYWDGYLGEIICFGSLLSSGDRSTVLASHQTYWGTP